jgi:hypothetical protein
MVMDLESVRPKHPDRICIWLYHPRKLAWIGDCGVNIDGELVSKMRESVNRKFGYCFICGRYVVWKKEIEDKRQAPNRIWLTLDYEYKGEKYFDWTSDPNGPEDIPYLRTDIVAEALEAIEEDSGSLYLSPIARGCEILKKAIQNE